MPRNVRPAWIETQVDSRPAKGTGPKGRDGRLASDLYVRENGTVAHALTLVAQGNHDVVRLTVNLGLAMTAVLPDGNLVTLPAGTMLGMTVRQ